MVDLRAEKSRFIFNTQFFLKLNRLTFLDSLKSSTLDLQGSNSGSSSREFVTEVGADERTRQQTVQLCGKNSSSRVRFPLT